MAVIRHPAFSPIPLYVRDFLIVTWDQVIKRLTVIEAEVRYAVRHEYALTAVDVIARRCRLSFLNAQTALDALPRIIDIMSEELHWSAARKRKEVVDARSFLQSMGLPPSAEHFVPQEPAGMLERVGGLFERGKGRSRLLTTPAYSRAQFEPGQVDELRRAFTGRLEQGVLRLAREDVLPLVRALPGYESVRQKDFEYVLEETGFARQRDVDFDEFVEVREL